MSKELFANSIRKHVPISDDDVDFIWNLSTQKVVKKGQFIIHNGNVAHKTCFISSGAVVGYFIDNKGEEHLLQFGFDGWWISDIMSFLNGSPAVINVQAITDSVIAEFTNEAIQKAFQNVPAFQSYFLAITQKAFANFQLRTLNNLSMTAEERYLDFCTKYSQIETRLTQKWIASYLGISPEFLSRLKRKLLEN